MLPHNVVYPQNYSQMGSTSNVQYAPNMPMAYAQPGFHQQQYVVLPQGYPITQQLQQAPQQHPQQAQQQQPSMSQMPNQVPVSITGYPGQYSQAPHMHNLNNQSTAIATTMASPSTIEKPTQSRERVAIRLVDPESGKDVLSEIRAKKER